MKNDVNYSEGTKIYINEYEIIKDLEKESTESLEKRGYSQSQINKIKNSRSDMIKEIKNRANLNDNQLKSMKYDDNQIKIIRNFAGSDAELTALAAQLTLYLVLSNYKFNGTETTCDVYTSWVWSTYPITQFNDGVAIAWSESFNSYSARTYINLYYTDVQNGNEREFTSSGFADYSPGGGFYVVFPLTKPEIGIYYKCLRGSVRTQLYKNGNIPTFEVISKYVHSQIYAYPSITLPGGASINVGWHSNTMGLKKSEVRNGVISNNAI